MDNLIEKLKEMQKRQFKVTTSRGALSLQQTQRNQAKAEILEALYQDLKETLEEEGFNVYLTHYGPVIELLNNKVEDQVIRMDDEDICTGMISIQMDAVMKNLDTNPELDEADYFHEMEQKKLREQEKEKAKRKKIERDAEIRAEKKRQREEKLAKIMKSEDDKNQE